MTRVAAQRQIVEVGPPSAAPIRGEEFPLTPANTVLPLPQGLSDLITGGDAQLNQLSKQVAMHLDAVREGREQLRSADRETILGWGHSFTDKLNSQTGDLVRGLRRDNIDVGGRSTLRLLDACGESRTLFEILTAAAQAQLAVAEGVSILSGRSVEAVGHHWCSPVTVGFSDHLGRYYKNLPLVAWSDERNIDLKSCNSLEGVLTSILRLKPFGFMEFITGGVLLLNGADGAEDYVPLDRRKTGIFTGFELLAHLATARGDSRPCTDLLSQALSDTWKALHKENNLSHSEYDAVTLPFQYSKDIYRLLMVYNAGCKTEHAGSDWERAYKGLLNLMRISRGVSGVERSTPVNDYLGRELWSSLGLALNTLKELTDHHSQMKSAAKAARVAIGTATPASKHIANKVKQLIDEFVLAHPRKRLIEGNAILRRIDSQRVISLSEVDQIEIEPPFNAVALVRQYGSDIDAIYEKCSEQLVYEVGYAAVDASAARGSLITLDQREKLKITLTNGAPIFQSVDHFYHYQREVTEWMNLQLRCVIEVIGGNAPSWKTAFVSGSEKTVGEEYLDTLVGSLNITDSDRRALNERDEAEQKEFSATTRLIAPQDLRNDLPIDLEPDARSLCSRYPALWPLYFPRTPMRIDTSRVQVVPGFSRGALMELLKIAPGRVLESWREAYPDVKALNRGAQINAIERNVLSYFLSAEKLIVNSGFLELKKKVLRMQDQWGTVPSEFEGQIFADQEGRVVAENFGHYVSMYLMLADLAIDAGLTAAKSLGIESSEELAELREGLEENLSMFGDFSDVISYHGSGLKKPPAWEASNGIRATLETLSHRDTQVALKSKKVSVLQAHKVLNEVAQQMFGASSYSSVFDPWIKHEVFSSKSMGFQCMGVELIRYARGEKPTGREGPKGKNLARGLDPLPSPARALTPPLAPRLIKIPVRYGLTRGQSLREEARANEVEFYGQVLASYPSLAPLFYPRYVKNAEINISADLDWRNFFQRLREIPGAAAGRWRIEKSEWRSKLIDPANAKIAFIADYSNKQRDLIGFLSDLIAQGLDRADISPANWSTTPTALDGVVFTDGSGEWVIAENFGHLVTMTHDLYRLCMARKARLAKDLRVELGENESGIEMGDEGFHSILQNHVIQVDPPPVFTLPTGEFPAVTLAAFRKNSVREAAQRGSLTPEQALELLNEASLQLYGAQLYHQSFSEKIGSLAFCDAPRTFGVTGRDLISALAAPEDSYPTPQSDSALPLTKPLSKREAKAARIHRKNSIYQEMFRNREVPLGTLFFASCALGDAIETGGGYRAFKGALLPAIESTRDVTEPSVKPTSKPTDTDGSARSPVAIFSDLVNASDATTQKVDLSAIGRSRLAQLLFQLCYRSFSGDVNSIVSELEHARDTEHGSDTSREVVGQILDQVVPLLVKQLERERDFRIPGSIRFTPFGYQRAWASAALSTEVPILVGAPGSGKTEMGVLLSAAYLEGDWSSGIDRHPRRVLWLTTPSNIEETTKRIANRISIPVLQLTSQLLRKSPQELGEELSQFSFITFTYTSNAALWHRRPAHFAVIREWLRGGSILDAESSGLANADEGHLLDNARSHRSQAVRALGAEKVVVYSGTPVQHRRENIATQLHTTLPQHYPDVDALRRAFKQDKALALALFHQHTTVIGMDQISRTFRPFSEISAKQQVALGLPCVPRVHEHFKSFQLSIDHTRRYINIALGESGASTPGFDRSAHLRRFAKIRRLFASPTKLGAEPAFGMLQAVKEIALPAMQRGEKVIILGEHLDPLGFIAQDPEIKACGVAMVTGTQSTQERAHTVQRLLHDPKLMCAVGQIRVLGTGHDCLGVEHVLFIEPPRVVSDLLQGMSRHRRLITEDTLPFARSDVHVWYLRPQLDREVVDLIPSAVHREVLQRGSVYERAVDRIVAQAHEYAELTSHPTKIKIEEGTTLAELVGALSNDLKTLEQEREEFHDLTEARLEELFLRYRSPEKKEWREKGLMQFLGEALPILNKARTELSVALLPGPEALEIPVYCDQGLSPSQIFAFESSSDEVVREHCSRQVQRFGARFFSSRMEVLLPQIEREAAIDILSLDTNGYMTPDLFKMVVSWRMPQQGVLLKNALCGREQGAAAELLAVVGNNRRELDRMLLRLAGTQLDRTLQIQDMPALITAARSIEAFCECIAEAILPHIRHTRQELATILMGYACGSSVPVLSRQFEYTTSGGSPFLSSFMVLERQQLEFDSREGEYDVGATLRELGLQFGSNAETISFKVEQTEGFLIISVDLGVGQNCPKIIIPIQASIKDGRKDGVTL